MSDFGAGIFDQDPTPSGRKEPQPQPPGQEAPSARRSRRRRSGSEATAQPESGPVPATPAAPEPGLVQDEAGEVAPRTPRRRGRRRDEDAGTGMQEPPVAAPTQEPAPRRGEVQDARRDLGPYRGEFAPVQPQDQSGPSDGIPPRTEDEMPAAREAGEPGEFGQDGERRRRRRRGRRRGRGRRDDDLPYPPREGGEVGAAADGPESEVDEDMPFAGPEAPAAQDRGTETRHEETRHPHHGRERDRWRDEDRGHHGRDDRRRNHGGPRHGHPSHPPRENAPVAPATPVASVAVLVDLVALENEVRAAGGEVAFRKLLSFLANGRKVTRAICYLPEGTPARGSIAGSGFQVQPIHHPEDLPLRAAVDAAELSADLDAVMLVPGTHGLLALADVLREKGVTVETAGFDPAPGTSTRHRSLGRESMFVP